MEVLCGRHVVRAALAAGRRKRVSKVFASDAPESLAFLEEAEVLAKHQHKTPKQLATTHYGAVPVQRVSTKQLDTITGSSVHQGIAIQATAYPFLPWSLEAILDDQGQTASGSTRGDNDESTALRRFPIYVLLAGVQDPVNAGSIMRSAYCLGATRVFLGTKETLGLTPACSKSSSGAMELLDIHRVKDEVSLIKHCRNAGIPALLASAAPISAAHPHLTTACENVHQHPLVQACGALLVVGNEHKGVSSRIRRECAATLAIPQARSHLVDSLNVGVATGILLHHIAAQLKLHAHPPSVPNCS